MPQSTYPKISRNNVFEFIAKAKIAVNSIAELEAFTEQSLADKNHDELLKVIIENVQFFYAGYSNGFLSDIYYVLTNNRVEVIGEVAELYPCDCCGRLSLTEKQGIDDGGWDICAFCGWEDTGITTGHCGCNHDSIENYRRRIEESPNFYYREMFINNDHYERGYVHLLEQFNASPFPQLYQQKFTTAKLVQTPELVKDWYDYDDNPTKLIELTKDALADDFERLDNDDLASKYADYIVSKMNKCNHGRAVSNPKKYKTRIITLPELGEAICGIRFRSMQVDKPFVNVAITTEPLTVAGMAKAVAVLKKEFAEFLPTTVRFYLPADGLIDSDELDKLGLSATWDRVLLANQFSVLNRLPIHSIRDKYTLSIARNLDFCKDYAQAIEELFIKKPAFKDYTRCETREDLQWVMDNGGFNLVLNTVDDMGKRQFAGLMVVAKDTHAGLDGYYVMDKLLVPHLHGQGLGKQLENWAIETLINHEEVSADSILFGEIDFNNKGSLHSAYVNGRVEVGRYLWVY